MFDSYFIHLFMTWLIHLSLKLYFIFQSYRTISLTIDRHGNSDRQGDSEHVSCTRVSFHFTVSSCISFHFKIIYTG